MHHQPSDPAGRIRRLTQAIGTNHATNIDPDQHLRAILIMIGDKAALRLFNHQRKAA